MDIKELMIGDWIHLQGHPEINTQVQETDFVNLSEYEPILLTPEILEKNGFCNERDVGYIFDDYSGTQIIYDAWNYHLKINIRYKTVLDIENFDTISVHELQHALRLCGIEKEITLQDD